LELKKTYAMTKEQLYTRSQGKLGLSTVEVARLLADYGANELPAEKRPGLIARFINQLADPMVVILLVAATISAFLGEWTDSGVIAAVVVLNAALGLYQEGRAARAAEALAALNSPTALVRREGRLQRIASRDLVCGDLVQLETGDAVPADIRLIEAVNLRVDESSLTGESQPVDKIAEPVSSQTDDPPLSAMVNTIFMGSPVVYGRGMGIVVATGADSRMGKIAGLLTNTDKNKTPLQKRLAGLSKTLSLTVCAICLIVFFMEAAKSGFHSPVQIIAAFMLAVSLAVAAIPEGLVVVVTLVLSLGMKKMSRAKAIIRRLSAVETLGSVQVICSDKTGTLTQNRMSVRQFTGNSLLLKAVCLCNDCSVEEGMLRGEPTERALLCYGIEKGLTPQQLRQAYPRCHETPFDSGRKLMTTYHLNNKRCLSYTKGAPERVLSCCDRFMDEKGLVRLLTDTDRRQIMAQNEAMADQALRVLAGAYGEAANKAAAVKRGEKGLIFLGLLGLSDPPRPEVKLAVSEAKAAGIKVVMVSGDHPRTAIAIAGELGIYNKGDQAVVGAEMAQMSDKELKRRLKRISVFARVLPEDKLRIVRLWQELGQVTAMTGDGVNDAPALKAADIGVGMGRCGSEVSRRASALVLADDNFATIVSAVAEGRRIYENIRRALQFLLSSNLAEVLAIFFASLVGIKLFMPIHLLWINLVTDCFPAIALGMEEGDRDAMKRPPHKTKEGVFAGKMGFDIIWQGIIMAFLVLVSYTLAAPAGTLTATSMAFITLITAELAQAFNMRNRIGSIFALKVHNHYLLAATMGAIGLNLFLLYIPAFSTLFQLTALTMPQLSVGMGLGFLMIPLVEAGKYFRRITEGTGNNHQGERRLRLFAGKTISMEKYKK